jgi:hypothetical protein
VRRFYNVYQFVVPVVLFPLAYWLWLERFGGDHRVTLLVMFVPVIAYYAFVMIGIMKFRLWRMNTRPTIRGFRPHHGFVLGSGAALLIYLSLRMVPISETGPASLLTSAFLGASVFGFWNWWYETYAIKSGFISIYTKKIAEGATAEEAVTDYAPVLFGTMGACYAAMVKLAENLLFENTSDLLYWSLALGGGLAIIAVPTLAYTLTHRIRHGESGLKTYIDVIEDNNRTQES